jgi:hypothetical protein
MSVSADALASGPASEPPRHRGHIFTRSGLLLELGIVTAGVLIALSVDTVRVWRTHQSLAAEARSQMLSEVAQNKKALERVLASLDGTQKTYFRALRDARGRLAGKAADTGDFNMSVSMAPLSSAAYTTAEITGALGYMNYDEVRRFADVYEAQRRYQALQDEIAIGEWEIATPVMFGGSLLASHPRELEAWTHSLEQLIAKLLSLHGFGEGLRIAYVGILKPQ